jgi:hypothetical protein
MTDSSLALLFVFVGLPIIGFVLYQAYAAFRDAPRPGALGDHAASAASASSLSHSAPTVEVALGTGTNPAFAWNVAVIVVGGLIAAIGLGAWLLADPTNSAFRQTVAALWLIAGLLGLVIAAIGTLGATIVHVLKRPNG